MVSNMSCVSTQKMRLCMREGVCVRVCVCVCASNRETEPLKEKKTKAYHLLGCFQKLLLMLATWHCLIKFALLFQSASKQL